jgi:1,4-alpha-glucan branching enzyme
MPDSMRNDGALDGQAEAIVQGRHADPFAYLGPHRRSGGAILRVMQPAAQAVDLLDPATGKRVPLERVHRAGLFAVELAAMPAGYRLCIAAADGSVRVAEDPYRFSSPLGPTDEYLIAEGKHQQLYQQLGANRREIDGVSGVHFAVWAPNASRVSVVADFNGWDGRVHPMRRHPGIGVWDIFIPGVADLTPYKFELTDRHGHLLPLKSDPFARYQQAAPDNASLVYASHYQWNDEGWLAERNHSLALQRPVSIYEVHLGSWRRRESDGQSFSYRELAVHLLPYVRDMGFTHIELLPVSEYPFDGSWGYQPVGLFAPTSRFGAPDDLRFFIDACHQAGIGVIIDWVAGHFPRDPNGLFRFDGTALYEHEDPRRGVHVDWDTAIFNYGRREVANYLLANALYWIKEFHVDGFRVDAVASMLYLDYSRQPGEWLPNARGGNENDDAIAFLREFNKLVHAAGAVSIAEESTAWPGVSRPTYAGGLGFTYKWNMGWMHDTLAYMREDPIHRSYHHDRMTFGLIYSFYENFVLPLSHDEVVHGKGSLIARMPGDQWQRFANMRSYLAFMYAYPGKKLLFMGAEFAQHREWDHRGQLDWYLLDYPEHAGMSRLVRDLNRVYRELTPLHERDCDSAGFQWSDCNDRANSVLSWLRWDSAGRCVIAVSNFTPVTRYGYVVGVPFSGAYREVLNTDAAEYGGAGVGNLGQVEAESVARDGFAAQLSLTLPPLATLILQPVDPHFC